MGTLPPCEAQATLRSPSFDPSTDPSPRRTQAGGDKYDDYNAKEKSQTRVDIKKDAGYTRADGGNCAYLCLFFARGCCPYGYDPPIPSPSTIVFLHGLTVMIAFGSLVRSVECAFLHKLPPKAHELPDASMDVFGREKHSDYRDDMGGVGSFTRQNRTLYIGKLTETRDTADVLEKHFEEFGEIERSKFLSFPPPPTLLMLRLLAHNWERYL